MYSKTNSSQPFTESPHGALGKPRAWVGRGLLDESLDLFRDGDPALPISLRSLPALSHITCTPQETEGKMDDLETQQSISVSRKTLCILLKKTDSLSVI